MSFSPLPDAMALHPLAMSKARGQMEYGQSISLETGVVNLDFSAPLCCTRLTSHSKSPLLSRALTKDPPWEDALGLRPS